MATAPVIEPTTEKSEIEEVLSDPQVHAFLEALDDKEDGEDLLEALIVGKRIAEGKERTYSLEEVKKKLGLRMDGAANDSTKALR